MHFPVRFPMWCPHYELPVKWWTCLLQLYRRQLAVSHHSHKIVVVSERNVPVKSKLKHPLPRAYPRHLTSFATREGGNLMNLVFPGAGHLLSTHRGWGIWLLASIACYVALISRGMINHGGDKPWCIQSERYPIPGKLAEKQRLAQALLCIWRYSRTICIIFGIW